MPGRAALVAPEPRSCGLGAPARRDRPVRTGPPRRAGGADRAHRGRRLAVVVLVAVDDAWALTAMEDLPRTNGISSSCGECIEASIDVSSGVSGVNCRTWTAASQSRVSTDAPRRRRGFRRRALLRAPPPCQSRVSLDLFPVLLQILLQRGEAALAAHRSNGDSPNGLSHPLARAIGHPLFPL